VLAARRHGETSAVVSLLTREHGRHAGLVRGGAGRARRAVAQPGNTVAATWRARLADHLGAYRLELVRAYAAAALDEHDRLAAIASACALAEAALPERHPYPAIYQGLLALLGIVVREASWPAAYVRWELGILDQLGFGLDLSACAVTGARGGLAYVSPRSGRAVTAAAAGRYRARLLPLPGFLVGAGEADGVALAQGLRLTGSFLDRHLFAPHGRRLPPARERLVAAISLSATGPGGVNDAP
jgi:DNA repair protein RecO (recombination protein O)